MRRFLLLFLTLCLLFVSCSKNVNKAPSDEAAIPAIDVYVCAGMERYPAIKALLDAESLDEIEGALGYSIELHVFDSETNSIDIASSGFDGILLVDDPAYTVRLSNAKAVDKLKSLDVNRNFGTNNGEQYGYVFSGFPGRTPILLVNVDAFESNGIKEIPFTMDALYDALKELQTYYQVPLALCGNPIEAGYFVIQQLYGLSPLGGMEFSVSENGDIIYDKLSQKGSAYLEGVRKLFSESLIPSDMLILNEYGVMKMLLNNVSAAAVFTDMTYALETVQRMEAQGRHVAVVKLPVDESKIEFDIYKQLLGFVSKGYEHSSVAMDFFMILDEVSSRYEFDVSTEGLEQYELFSNENVRTEVASEFLGDSFYAMILYYKSELDLRFLIPYYSRIASCDYDLSRFDEMVDTWMATEISTNYEYVHGKALLRMFKQMISKGGVK